MRLLLLPILLLLGACAGESLVSEADPGGGAAAALHWSVETPQGRFLGSATAIGPQRLVTNRHVVGSRQALRVVRDGVPVPVRRILRADGLDAAVLELAEPLGPAGVRPGPLPAAGQPLFIAGARGGRRQAGTGRSIASSYGPGYAAARLPAAPGFSGGPILDGQARLVGIVAAAVEPDLASARALSHGGADTPATPRLVLYLPIRAVLAAAEAASR